MSHFVYRGYQHETGEANLTRMTIEHVRSPRGLRMETLFRLYVQGEIMADGAAATLTRANEIITAYSLDYGNARLFLDDGTPTPHGIDNDSPFNLTGVRVVDRSWPRGGAEELANMRTFKVTLESMFADNESQLIRWEEQLEFVGTGGPSFEDVNTFFGPRRQITAQATAQRVVQSGSAIGYTAYVEPSPPLFPEDEHLERRVTNRGTGKQRGKIATFYPSTWTYFFSLLTPASGVPWTR